MKIAHISDIHWRGLTRHDEYTNIHNKLFTKLRELQPDIILCTGDIFHTKTQGISPEVVDKLVWSFRELARIAPFHTILGNHDGNLANESRQDVISPIIEAMKMPRIRLYKQSGVYPLTTSEGHVINLCNFSCFDKEGWSKVKPVHGVTNIALYHGSLTGCLTDSDWVMSHGEEKVTIFDDYDFALLGDIHKQQFMAYRKDKYGTTKPNIGYPGSLIQQNYGEDETKGFYLWDIRAQDDWDVQFHALENETPFITIPWMGDVKGTLDTVVKIRGDKSFQKGARVRVVSDQSISQVEKRQLFQEIREKRGCAELAYKTISNGKGNLQNINTGGVSVHKTSLRNDVKTLCKLYREYAVTHLGKLNLTAAQLEDGEELIQGYLKKLNDQDTDTATRDVQWSIKSMEFDNLFRYGAGNKVDFTKLSGVVGVFGPNKVGKSSIISSLCYGLFNKTDRESVKSAEIINRNKRTASCKVAINVAGVDYVINRNLAFKESKKGKPSDDDKVTTTLTFHKVEKNNQVVELANENDDSRTDTDKLIRKLIGTKEDFMMTALSSQYASNNFIGLGATQRKSVLNRFLDMDIFEKLYKYANDDCAALNARTGKFQTVTWESNIIKAQRELEEKELQLVELSKEIDENRVEVDELRLWVKQHQAEYDAAKNQQDLMERLDRETTDLSDRLFKLEQERDSKRLLHDQLELLLLELKKVVDQSDYHGLLSKKQQLEELNKQHLKARHAVEVAAKTLEGQKKSVRKLDLVPCGDQFPTCLYIKDSHEDKALVVAQQEQVQSLSDALKDIAGNLGTLLGEQVEQKLAEHEKRVKFQDTKTAELTRLTTDLNNLGRSIDALTVEFNEKMPQLKKLQGAVQKESELELFESSKSLQSMTKTLTKLENNKNNLLMTIGSLKTKIAMLSQEMEECKDILERLQVHNSIVEAFSKNGIPAMVLMSQLPIINDELDKITANLGFKLTLETEVNSNTLEVFIENEQPKRVIELCSGAEMALASLAIRVALTTLSSLPKSDILIVDEGFGSLDEENVPKCLQLLTLLKGYFRLVLIVSHIPQIKEAAERIVDISNNGLESSIFV